MKWFFSRLYNLEIVADIPAQTYLIRHSPHFYCVLLTFLVSMIIVTFAIHIYPASPQNLELSQSFVSLFCYPILKRFLSPPIGSIQITSANKVDLGFFVFFINFQNYPPQKVMQTMVRQLDGLAQHDSPMYSRYFFLLERMAVVEVRGRLFRLCLQDNLCLASLPPITDFSSIFLFVWYISQFYSPLEWCRSDWTGLGFVCFVVINPRVLSANRVDFGLFCFINFPILLPPPPPHNQGLPHSPRTWRRRHHHHPLRRASQNYPVREG